MVCCLAPLAELDVRLGQNSYGSSSKFNLPHFIIYFPITSLKLCTVIA